MKPIEAQYKYYYALDEWCWEDCVVIAFIPCVKEARYNTLAICVTEHENVLEIELNNLRISKEYIK